MKKLYMLKAMDSHDTEVKLTIAENDYEARKAWSFHFEDGGYATGSTTLIEEVDGHIVRVEEKDAISMYFVTTFQKLEREENGFWELGSKRTVGFYPTLEAAQDTVINNRCDLRENIYDYAVIEELGIGLYPTTGIIELYKVQNPMVLKEGKEVYDPDLLFEKIELPKEFPTGIVFG
ncbi:hypothetical protein ACFVS2_20775 [Brevibacillus sp. NPDC058079]|uniref:hypothetical protein n=1 Tax=Brevibacillus sp. NPDC058079 TaxID=3346330 RepID=UPI0036EA5725